MVNCTGSYVGGTLIHENYVITAARCINGVDIVQRGYVLDFVRLGEYDLRTDPDLDSLSVRDMEIHVNH